MEIKPRKGGKEHEKREKNTLGYNATFKWGFKVMAQPTV